MRRVRRVAGALAAVLASLWAAPVPADAALVIYRCTDASGAVTLQNDVPCPRGHRQERRVIDDAPRPPAAPPSAAPVSAPVAPMVLPAQPVEAAAGPAAKPVIAPTATEALAGEASATPRLPPVPLFQCRTWDGVDFLTEDATPAERCAPLRTLSLDGRSQGAGSACEYRQDRCTPVADDALCEHWQAYVQQVRLDEGVGTTGRAEGLERQRAVSTCGLP